MWKPKLKSPDGEMLGAIVGLIIACGLLWFFWDYTAPRHNQRISKLEGHVKVLLESSEELVDIVDRLNKRVTELERKQ